MGLVFIVSVSPDRLLRPVWSDSAAYTAHAFTMALDFDFDYENEVLDRRPEVNGKVVPFGTFGPGLVAAPVVFFTSLIDRVRKSEIFTERSAFRGTWSFWGMHLAAMLSFLIGLVLYSKTFRLLGFDLSVLKVFVVAAASGLLYYSLHKFTMPHAHEFLALALVLYASILCTTQEYGRRLIFYMLFLGLALHLYISIRIGFVNIFLVPFIAYLYANYRNQDVVNFKRWGLLFFGACIIAGIPFWIIQYQIYGSVSLIASSAYSDAIGDRLISNATSWHGLLYLFMTILSSVSNIFPLLTSSEFGLLWSYPALLLGVAGVIYLFVTSEKNLFSVVMFLLTVMFAGYSFAVVLYWGTTGSHYGYRYLLSLFPIAIVGFLVCERFIKEAIQTNWVRRLSITIVVALFVFSALGSIFYDSGNKGLYREGQINVYGNYHALSAKGFNRELVKAVVTPEAWRNLINNRTPGFVRAKGTNSYRYLKNKMLFKSNEIEYGEYTVSYANAILQTLVLFIVWMLFWLRIIKKE